MPRNCWPDIRNHTRIGRVSICIERKFHVNYWDDDRSNRVRRERKSVRASNDAGQLEPIKGELNAA